MTIGIVIGDRFGAGVIGRWRGRHRRIDTGGADGIVGMHGGRAEEQRQRNNRCALQDISSRNATTAVRNDNSARANGAGCSTAMSAK